jgi:hypothetical protein
MLTRRKFLKIFGLASLAFSFLPSIFARKSFSSSSEDAKPNSPVRNWLYGSARRGCSSPSFAWEYHGRLEDGVKDLASFRLPPDIPYTLV